MGAATPFCFSFFRQICALYGVEKLGLAGEYWRLHDSATGSIDTSRSGQPLQMQPQHRHVSLLCLSHPLVLLASNLLLCLL